MTELSPTGWKEFLARFPHAHILQTPTWGAQKNTFGWSPAYLANDQAGAQILFRRLAPGLTIAYIPKGPVGEGWDSLLPEIDALCQRRRAVFLKVEPDCWQNAPNLEPPPGFVPSAHAVQPPRTLVLDLRGTEDQMLARMKQKTRYNIRLARKKGIVVRPSGDLDAFSRLMAITGTRDGFGVHSPGYYQNLYDLFHGRGMEVLLAEYQGEPLAALIVFARGNRAWYFYGASSNQERNRMPTYLLQWEAIRWAQQQGCLEYDLWGVPDHDAATLEARFTERSDGLWGVYRFKRGFGGELRRAAGPWDRVYRPALYSLYQWWISRRGGA